MITGTSIVGASPNQVSRDLDGERVILQLEEGRYFGLNAVGARVWHLLQQPRTVNEIRDTLVAEYEVAAEVCEKDLHSVFKELMQKGLVEVRG